MSNCTHDNAVKHVRGKTFLNGTTSIRKQRLIFYEDGTKKTEVTDYPLVEITPSECFQKRISLIPGFLLKIDGHLFFTELLKGGVSSSNFGLGEHLCFDCKHCSAASDENGGCAKIRDLFPKDNLREKGRWSTSNCMIEKYSFITSGYERFNRLDEALVVCKCLHFEKSDPHKKYSREEIDQMKLNLAQYLVPDATTLDEARAIILRDFSYPLLRKNFPSK